MDKQRPYRRSGRHRDNRCHRRDMDAVHERRLFRIFSPVLRPTVRGGMAVIYQDVVPVKTGPSGRFPGPSSASRIGIVATVSFQCRASGGPMAASSYAGNCTSSICSIDVIAAFHSTSGQFRNARSCWLRPFSNSITLCKRDLIHAKYMLANRFFAHICP